MSANEKSLRVGSRVRLTEKNLVGTVAYIGSTLFAQGKWIGVILDEPAGKNNGVVQGKEYFKCADNHGIFVRSSQVVIVDDENDNVAPEAGKQSDEKTNVAASGLRQPQTMKRSFTKGEEGGKEPSPGAESKMKLPVSTKSKMAHSPSSERLKQSPSVEKLKQSPSVEKLSTGMRHSPSSEKLAGVKESRAEPAGRRPQATPSSTSGPRGKMEKTSSVSSHKSETTTPEGAADDDEASTTNVASKISKIQQGMGRSSIEGIVRVAPANLSEGAELEYLRAEAKDLTEKLETLRARRQEDKHKLIDYEKCKIQLQQLVEYKTKMNEVHGELQKQLQQARKDAKEAIEARETYQDDMSGLSEAIEMATLDKEMAEERADMLQQEVDALRERVQELEADLEILKHDVEEKGGEAGAATAFQVKQLEQQNERLKEAVIKMRDLSAHERKETQRITKELETVKAAVSELQKKNEKLSEDVQKFEQQTVELKEQVDAALGSESMIEQLTTRNLALEERVRELEETVEDFEQMRQMDEELQESAKEQERELRQDLDVARGKINELRGQLQQSYNQVADYEMTIRKFRDHTAQLQEQIQDLKDKLLIKESKQELGEDGDSRASAFGRGKSFAEAVEGEILKIETGNHVQHMRYLRSFLPDNFAKFGGDNDALLLTLLFPRFAGKAQLLITQLNEKYPQVPGGVRREHVVKSHKSEQWSFVAKFTYYLNSLIAILHSYDSILNQCSVERLLRLAKLQPEMSAQERLIDSYFDLLKLNRIDENTSLDNVEKSINYFRNLYTVHLASEQYDGTIFANDIIRQLLSGTVWFKLDLTRTRFYLLENQENSSLWKSLDDMQIFIDDAEQFLRSAKTRIPQDSKTHVLKLPVELPEALSDTASNLEKAAELLHLACKSASTEVSMLPDVEGVDAERMNDHLQRALQKMMGKGAENKSAQDAIKLSLGILLGRSSKLAETLESGQLDIPVSESKPFPPILERAHARKQDAVEADSLRWQIEKKENEIIELKKALRLKAEEISEMNVRKEMAEKRLATSGKEGDERIVRLQRKIEEMQQDYKKKEREFEQAMDTLQQEIDNLEAENNDLKERNKMMSKKALLQGISAQGGLGGSTTSISGSPVGIPSPLGTPQESPFLIQQIEQLKTALTLTREEKCAVIAEKMHQTMMTLPPLNVPKKSIGLTSSTGLVDLDQLSHKRHDEVNHLLRETTRLQKDFQNYVSNLKVIDISKRKASEEPLLEKQTPAYHFMATLQKAKKLNDWVQDLNVRMQRYRAVQLTGGAGGGANVGRFPALGKDGVPKEGSLLARVSIPCTNGEKTVGGKVIPVYLSQTMNSVNVEALSNEELRDQLTKRGQPCGPIVKTTRKLYENKLKKLIASTDRNIPTAVQSTPSPASGGSNRASATSSSGSGRVNRSDYFDDASDQYDDERMEGEESFRYVGPKMDTPPSPYSALGGSMIATPPVAPRAAPSTTPISSRLDFGLNDKYSPPKPSSYSPPKPSTYSFSTNRTPVSKTSTISYHAVGGYPLEQPYRRSTIAPAVAPRVAEPTIPYGLSNSASKRFTSLNGDYSPLMNKVKHALPSMLMAFAVIVLVIFIVFFINKIMQETIPADEDPKLPA